MRSPTAPLEMRKLLKTLIIASKFLRTVAVVNLFDLLTKVATHALIDGVICEL